MTLPQIEREISAMSPDEQDELAAFLLKLRLKREGRFEEASARLREDAPEKWMSWKNLDESLNAES